MRHISCPWPCKIKEEKDDSDKSQSKNLGSESSSSSSFNYSLSSQPSLPSVPSLTPPSQPLEQPSNACLHSIATLRGNSSYVFSLALSGKYLYSGSSSSEIRVWSRDPSGQAVDLGAENVVAEGNSSVKCIVILGDKLFSAHQDHKIRVWRINNDVPNAKYKCIATLPTMNDRCMKILLPRNYQEVRRHKKCTWVHHVDAVSALALSKDGSLLYSASWDRTFKVWRTSDFKCLESVWKAHDDAINAIVSSKDGYVYTGSADKKIKVWKMQGHKVLPGIKISESATRHKLVATLEKHKSAVNALAVSSDGSVLYSGACDRSIIVWEKDGGGDGQHMVVAGALRGHSKAILCLAVVDDVVFSGSADKTIRVWRRGIGKSYNCLAVLEGHNKPVKCLTAAPDNNTNNNSSLGKSYVVYSGSLDCDIKMWLVWVPTT